MMSEIHYTVTHSLTQDDLHQLAQVLTACVEQGASVGFVQPFGMAQALSFWQGIQPGVESGERTLLLARQAGRIVGTVQLLPAMMPNGPHRAEVAKLLVHPAARRQGVARALMQRLDEEALARGRRLLVLDTRSGDHAERLYQSLGYQLCGQIPRYVLSPDGRGAWEPTTVMYRQLA